MIRRPSSLRSAAAAASIANTSISAPSMSYCPYFPVGHPRAYSSDDQAREGHADFVSGDSHFQAVRETNRGFRPNYRSVPPPTQYHVRPVSNEGVRSGPNRPVGPGNFRPQQMRPQRFKPKPPDYREWEYAKKHPPAHCERFTILSYNILADSLATDHYQKLYFHIPHYMMDWGWRKRSLTFELGLWSADILCLQEVDRFQDLMAELKPRGYSGIWKMRTGDHADGCAIFWRDSRFKLLHEESIEFNKLFLRDNVAQICVFESLNGHNSSTISAPLSSSVKSNRVVVCNIHVLFNPKRGDIKLGQIRVLLDRACAVSKLWDDAPIVICGDFNSTPKSPLYNFITERKLDLSDLPRDKVSGQASAEIYPPKPAWRDPRMQPSDDSTQVCAVNNNQKTEQKDLQSDSTKNQSADHLTQVSISSDCKRSEQGDLLLPKVASTETHSSHASGSEWSFERNVHTSPDVSISKGTNDGSSSYESTSHEVASFGSELDEKFDSLTLNQANGDEPREEADTFLSELHGTDQLSFLDESGSSPHDQKLQSIEDEILDETISEILSDEGKLYSSRSLWTPSEIEAATGNADCRVMEHSLKMRSAYSQVVNSSGSRDSSGEPLVTSYHLRFSGTVDYIWHSEGLETARVLAPIPKHVMHQTRGFPTKKWGSDHIALVSELAFVSENTSQ